MPDCPAAIPECFIINLFTMKYKLVQRKNPQKRDDPAKWYASPMNDEALSVKATMEQATMNTTTAPIEMEASFELFENYSVYQLRNGISIRLGNMGIIRITFKSDGAETVKDFKPQLMIHDARMVFTPSKAFREKVINSLSFENAGVLADGIEYASIESYLKATGQWDDSTTEPDDGGDDGPAVG